MVLTRVQVRVSTETECVRVYRVGTGNVQLNWKIFKIKYDKIPVFTSSRLVDNNKLTNT